MEIESVPLWLHDFQLHVTGSLSRLELGQAGITDWLKRLNGTVASDHTGLQDLGKELFEHGIQCPAIARITRLERAAEERGAADRQNRKLYERMLPWLKIAAVLLAGMLLDHWHGSMLRGLLGG